MSEHNIYRRDDFIAELGISAEDLQRWEQMGIVRSPGTIDDDIPFYTEENLKQAQHVMELLRLGYGLDDIQKIVRKVGMPSNSGGKRKPKRSPDLITVGELAELTGLGTRTIKYWEERGILEPDGRSTGGFRLYARETVDLCLLIKDLQTFGYTLEDIKRAADLLRDFVAIQNGSSTLTHLEQKERLEQIQQDMTQLGERLSAIKQGIKRWESFIRKRSKEVHQALQKAGEATVAPGNEARPSKKKSSK